LFTPVDTERALHEMVINLLLGNAMAFAEAMALGEGLGLSQRCCSIHCSARLLSRRFSRRSGEYQESELRGGVSVALDAEGHASRLSECLRNWCGLVTNNQNSRLAMREGHATEDFSLSTTTSTISNVLR
jgi:hypothetical protein